MKTSPRPKSKPPTPPGPGNKQMPAPSSGGMLKSRRPMANPARKKPMPNPMNDRMSPQSIEARTLRPMAKGGKISEYGGKEMYKSKSAMMKHEGKESMAMEKKEARMAKGGMCRGMGAASKGGKYKG